MSSSLEEEMIALRWNNHMATMSQLLCTLREEESMIDVTLACDGKLLPAHKFVLSMCSDYFKEMFTSNPCKHPIVFMKDVHCGDLEALLDFMYRGVVHIQKTALSSLLKTAEGLQIRGLGLFAQEAVQQIDSGTLHEERFIPAENDEISQTRSNQMGITASQSGEERISLTALEPSVFLSPDRKRPYDNINTTVSSDHDASTSLGNFSEADLDDHSMTTSVNHSTPSASSQSLHKKSSHRMIDHPPATVPELPKVGEDQLDIGCGVTIPAGDYMKLRRTNANRYINDLLRYFFSLEVLAMSSLTGGECFANRGKTQGNKNQLDPNIIRVITNDAIRNFPMITEKQVRNAIRRKLNTESRTFRGLGKIASGVRRPPTKRRSRQTPRPLVSIERSSHALHSETKTMLQHQPVTPNVTLEKTSGLPQGLIFRTKDLNLTSGTLVNRIQQQQQQQQTPTAQQQAQQPHQQPQQQYSTAVVQQSTITSVGGISATAQCISLATSDKRTDDEAAAASAAAYFSSNAPATASSSRGTRDRSPPPSHHTSNSGTPPLVTPSLPPASSPSTTISEKTFNLVKAEVGGGGSGGAGGAQYLPQEYSYLPHVSQPPTAYLSHHITDPTYLRRLEMSQAAAAAQHTTAAAAALSYSYPLPTSEGMEPSLHM